MTRPSAPPAKPARQVPKPGPSVREVQQSKPAKVALVSKKYVDAKKTVEAPIEHAPAVITSSRTTLIKVPAILMSAAYKDLCANIAKINKSTGISVSSLVESGHVRNAISTGCLTFDFVCGGGIAPGRFTVVPGREGSGKSTLVNTLASCCVLQGTPIGWFDAETALSADYASKIFGRFGIRFNDLLGIPDPKVHGGYIMPPIIHYYDDVIGERIFKTMHGIMKALPTIRQDADGNFWKLIVGKTKTEWVEDDRQGKSQFLFIIDSLPALLPEALDEDPDKSPMAVQARMLSESLKLVKGLLAQKNCTLIATNQLRLNPAARMCVHAETKISFVDGRSLTMKEVVENKIKGKVWSLNETTGKIEQKKITGWYENGMVASPSDWINFKTASVNTSNGVCGFTVTADHKIITDSGWKKAKDVKKSDKLLTRNESIINGTLREFLAGISVGDLSLVSWGKQTTMGICNNEQPEYLTWRLEKLGKFFSFKEYSHGKYGKMPENIKLGLVKETMTHHKNYRSDSRYDLSQWKEIIGPRSGKNIAKWFTPLALALWYMDDGCMCSNRAAPSCSISAKRFKNNSVELDYLLLLLSNLGIEATYTLSTGLITVNRANFTKMSKLICKYIPPCMQYKLPVEFQGKYKEFSLKAKKEILPEFVEILEISSGSSRKFRCRTKYDITVEDNHNYMVGNPQNGIIVHNSDPIYEPCGEAAKFYSDNRTRIMRVSPNTAGVPSGSGAKFSSEPGLNGGVDNYVYAKIQNTKNKAFAPFRESMLRIRFSKDGSPGDGICETWDCASYLEATGQMVQRGNTMTMNVRPMTSKAKNQELFSEGQRLSRHQFKTMVEDPRYKRSVYMHCLKQMRSGYGFELEREATKKLIASGAAKEGAEPVSIEA